ncbi:MAG: response regulator transcription factor [Armatimonadetes bacterium]|nr:response regulator transcription factor [Armatimonadota bacterium]
MPETESRKILIIEDDAQCAKLVATKLEAEGYEVRVAETGEQGLEMIAEDMPDLLILDLILPGVDGLEVCREIRRESDLPIIMLTAKSDEIDVVIGLEVGADDYITKPFGMRELVARVRSMLRRVKINREHTEPLEHLSFPDLEIDIPRRSVTVQGEEVHLTPKEFGLLVYLASRPNVVFTREDIVRDIWGRPSGGDLRTVDTHIKRLRRKIEENRAVMWSIATVWGIGYKFQTNE